MDANLVIREFKQGLDALYGSRLVGCYLYGSYSRGEHDSESDFDVLVVLDDVTHYAAEVERTSRLTSELSMKHRVSISRVFVSKRDWTSGKTPFLIAARQEAISA